MELPETFLKDLNDSQREAVTHGDGPVLVIAGAGSGKTRVIEYRVLHLVQQGVDPESILLLTFTRRAASEMLTRAASRDPRASKVDGGTFHAFAYRWLRKYAKILGLSSSFTVIDEGDAEETLHRLASSMGLYDRDRRAPKKSTLRAALSTSLNKGQPIKEVLVRSYPQFVEYSSDLESLRRKYTEYKLQHGYVDYDDLLVYLKLLLEDPRVAEKLRQRYRYLMVDEFQDTNRLQGEITALLGSHGNVMVVGDDAQSIYGFRGATHGNILSFPEIFPNCRIITLEANYRSLQPILNVANAALRGMAKRYDKVLQAARDEEGTKPQLWHFQDAAHEAAWIARQVKYSRDNGLPLSRQAVLFRSSYVSLSLQAELTRSNIPYTIFGGLKFYETAHVKDILAFLKVAFNHRDELGWHRLLLLFQGVGSKTAESWEQEIGSLHAPGSLVEYFDQKASQLPRFSSILRDLAELFADLIDPSSSPHEQYESVVKFYRPLLRRQYDDWSDRLNDLEALDSIIAGYKTLQELLSDLALDPPERGVRKVYGRIADEEPLVLSTIHSAKGLEWEKVFFIGVSEGVLPSSFSLNYEDDLEEERRLFYVGVTRARSELTFSMHHESLRGGLSQFNRLSRFLDDPVLKTHLEMPADAVQDDTLYLDENGEIVSSSKKPLLDRLLDMYD